jgi:FemAB family protein
MMLLEDIKHIALSCGLSVKLRTEERSAWAEALLKCSYIPVAYTHSGIDFQWAYQRGHGGDWKDLSLVIIWNNKPAALWPLSLTDKDEKVILGSHGHPVLPPLFVAGCPASSRKRITKSCLDLARVIAKTAGIKSWKSAESFNDEIGLSDWHAKSMARGATCILSHELFLDLRPDMTEIKRNFRNSYKSLITAGTRTWSVGLLNTADEYIWNEFRELHLKVSGRKTRSDETWALHLQDIQAQQAFLVYLRNSDGEMVGSGFFNFTRDEGLYAVAAYSRSLFDKPLGHVVQYRAIEELKARGVRWYKIGARPYRSEIPTPMDKEISICEFKQGFASHLFPRLVLNHPTAETIMLTNDGPLN